MEIMVFGLQLFWGLESTSLQEGPACFSLNIQLICTFFDNLSYICCWNFSQCLIFGVVYVQSRDQLCDLGTTCIGKSSQVSNLRHDWPYWNKKSKLVIITSTVLEHGFSSRFLSLSFFSLNLVMKFVIHMCICAILFFLSFLMLFFYR